MMPSNMMFSQHNSPLVSVAVITYNSGKTVLETLESVKGQSYDNIELIISDDCSSDNTVQLCREWISGNKDRFVRTVVLECVHNTGIAGNGNRAEDACQGEWIKPIAGDDILMPACISDYVDFISNNPEAIVVFGRCSVFGGTRSQRRFYQEDVFKMDFFTRTAQEQFNFLLNENCIPAATVFYSLPKMRALGVRCDERIPLLEDLPRWLNLTRKGVRLQSIDKVTVKYRLNGMSSGKVNMAYYRSIRLFDFLYRYPLSCGGDKQAIIEKAVDYDCQLYQEKLDAYFSREYRIGYLLLTPLKRIAQFVKKLFKK